MLPTDPVPGFVAVPGLVKVLLSVSMKRLLARAGLTADVPTTVHDVARNRARILILLKDMTPSIS
jgi:hypothetical protein